MLAEERERSEMSNYPEDCIQFLEDYLRRNMSYDSMRNKAVRDAVEKRLAFTVKDFGSRHGFSVPDNDTVTIVNEAIDRFMDNWKDKTEGEDNRSHQLGKSTFK